MYLLLEYASKGNLFWFIRNQGYLEERLAARILYQTTIALGYLHSKGYIHRDMKPENLLLDEKEDIKLCDFGWCAEYEPEVHAMRNTFCGTYEYMAPEIFDKEPYDEKVDVWCLGILLYELVHGKSPYKGNTVIDIFHNIKRGHIVFSSRCSEEIKDLIKSILRREPRYRLSIKEILRHPFMIKYGYAEFSESDEEGLGYEGDERVGPRPPEFSNQVLQRFKQFGALQKIGSDSGDLTPSQGYLSSERSALPKKQNLIEEVDDNNDNYRIVERRSSEEQTRGLDDQNNHIDHEEDMDDEKQNHISPFHHQGRLFKHHQNQDDSSYDDDIDNNNKEGHTKGRVDSTDDRSMMDNSAFLLHNSPEYQLIEDYEYEGGLDQFTEFDEEHLDKENNMNFANTLLYKNFSKRPFKYNGGNNTSKNRRPGSSRQKRAKSGTEKHHGHHHQLKNGHLKVRKKKKGSNGSKSGKKVSDKKSKRYQKILKERGNLLIARGLSTHEPQLGRNKNPMINLSSVRAAYKEKRSSSEKRKKARAQSTSHKKSLMETPKLLKSGRYNSRGILAAKTKSLKENSYNKDWKSPPSYYDTKYFLGNPIHNLMTPRNPVGISTLNPKSAKFSGGNRRLIGPVENLYAHKFNQISSLNKSKKKASEYSKKKGSGSSRLNSSVNYIYRTFDQNMLEEEKKMAKRGKDKKRRQKSGDLKSWTSNSKQNGIFGSKLKVGDHSDHEIIRNLINRKMSQVKTRLRSQNYGNFKQKNSSEKKSSVRTCRIQNLGDNRAIVRKNFNNFSSGVHGSGGSSKNNRRNVDFLEKNGSIAQGCQDKLIACRELLDKISVRVVFRSQKRQFRLKIIQ